MRSLNLCFFATFIGGITAAAAEVKVKPRVFHFHFSEFDRGSLSVRAGQLGDWFPPSSGSKTVRANTVLNQLTTRNFRIISDAGRDIDLFLNTP